MFLKILCAALIICSTNIIAQDYAASKEINAYKEQINLLYNDILQNRITKHQAEIKLESLKNSKYSSNKKFYEILNSLLKTLINNINDKNVDTAKVYVVKEGDNLFKIAEKNYNNAYKWPVIYSANQKAIKNPDIIYPAQKLIIPPSTRGITNKQAFVNKKIDSSKQKSKHIVLNNSKRTVNSENEDIGIGGLVMDETFSKIGHDFYDLFYSNWESPQNVKDYTITISEKPLPQLGTQITIKVNDTPVFQRFIQPRYEIIEEMAQQGLAVSYSYLENYKKIQKELQGEDMSGTGIF